MRALIKACVLTAFAAVLAAFLFMQPAQAAQEWLIYALSSCGTNLSACDFHCNCNVVQVITGDPVYFGAGLPATPNEYVDYTFSTITGGPAPPDVSALTGETAQVIFQNPGTYSVLGSAQGGSACPITIVVTAPSPGSLPAPPNGVLYYTFDCPDVNRDASGHSFEGINGGATVVPGVVAQTSGVWGSAMHFVVNNGGQEYSTNDAPELRLTGNMSAIAWIKPYGPHDSDPPDCTDGTIFSKAGANWFEVTQQNDSLRLQNEGSGQETATVAFPNGPLTPGTWHQVAFVRTIRDTTVGDGFVYYVTFYLDGQQIGSPKLLFKASTANNNAPLVFGNYGFNGPQDCEFNGDLDEIHIFGDTCISDAFINEEYHRIHDSTQLLACPTCFVPNFALAWGSGGSAPGQFSSPYGMTTSGSGNVYVADAFNHRVQKFSGNGTFLTTWGSNGSADGQFFGPLGIATDAAENVYVGESGNRIQKFDANGNFLLKWGTAGSGDGQFNLPRGVAVDASGDVYVVEQVNQRVQKFDSNGNFLLKWGSSGSGPGQFSNPWGVAVDATGRVYVSDTNNSRVQVFNSNGLYLTEWGTFGSGDGQFSNPRGVEVDAAGNVYVADLFNNRVQEFLGDGTFLAQWGTSGSGPGQMNQPEDVGVSPTGVVYVADTGNQRIERFDCAASVTAVGPGVAGRRLDLGVSPNPSRGSVSFTLDVPRSADVALDIFDVAGRHVKTLLRARVAGGAQRIVWDGRGANGERVSRGIYFARARVGSDGASARVTIVGP